MYLEVPFISQLSFGRAGTDPTGCWYASARMVAAAFEYGPRLGVPQLYSMGIRDRAGKAAIGHWAIEQGWMPTLMENEHLVEVEKSIMTNAALLRNLIRLRGPLMFAWWKSAKGHAYGHMSTMIGVDGDEVIFHDPEDAPKSRMAMAQLRTSMKVMRHFPLIRRDAPPGSYMCGLVE